MIDLHTSLIRRITRQQPARRIREGILAWIEKTGQHTWRVRYLRTDGHPRYGSVSGFTTEKAAHNYAEDLESDQRRGTWLDPTAAKTTVTAWSSLWVDPLDVETRTDEDYRAYLRNHILPRWGHTSLGHITALDVTTWLKDLRTHLAHSTVNGILTVFSMMLDDAVITPRREWRRCGRCPNTSAASPNKPPRSAVPPPDCW